MNFFKNICCAVWDCVKGIAGGLWTIVKGMFKISGSIVDFLADVLDAVFELIADGIACLILLFIPSEKETATEENPLVTGFQTLIDNGQINFDDGISISEIKKKGAYVTVGVKNEDKKVMGPETIKTFFDAGDNSAGNGRIRQQCRDKGYAILKN